MSRFLLGDFRYRARDFARSNHSSRRLVLPISRPTTVSITPRRYSESPGSSQTARTGPLTTRQRLAAHGPHYAHGRFGPGNPFSAGLNRRCITYPASSRHLHPVNVLDSARRVRGAVLILVAGRARGGGGGPARGFARRRVPIGVSKKMLSWKAGSARKSHDSPPALV